MRMGDGMDCLPGMRAVEAGMPGKSTLTADAAEQAALRALSKSEQRGEADRARAILLTLEGRRAGEIAAVLGVHISTVRNFDAAKRREIAESVVSGRKSAADMARLYGVSQPTVPRIVAAHRAGRAYSPF